MMMIAIAIEVTVVKSLYNLVCTYLLQIPSETNYQHHNKVSVLIKASKNPDVSTNFEPNF